MLITLLLSALPMVQGLEVEKAESAVAQLQLAKQAKKKARGTKGAARVEALQNASSAYDSVVKLWPNSGVVVSEAAFRSGEISRTLGKIGAAKGSFEISFDHSEGSSFGSRALLEIGHIHRRESEMAKALEYYDRVGELKGAPIRYLNDSREWAGKVHFELGQWEEAISEMKKWEINAEGPIEQVKAIDLQVLCMLKLKQQEKATSLYQKTIQEMTPQADDTSKESARLKRALERMKSPALLDIKN